MGTRYGLRKNVTILTNCRNCADVMQQMEELKLQHAREKEAIERENADLRQAYKLDALRDSLTKLHNRAYSRRILNQLYADLSADKIDSLCVFIIDIDYFKGVNDTYGHDEGDKVIQRVARAMAPLTKRYLRFAHPGRHISRSHKLLDFDEVGGTLGRWGGEEFLVGLVNVKDPIAVAEQLRRNISRRKILLTDEKGNRDKIHITVSIGVAITTKQEWFPLQNLLKFADHALYKAKREGRNNVQIYKASDYEPQ